MKFQTTLYSIVVFLMISLYLNLYYSTFSWKIANKAFAHTGFILIGISFMLSSLCYFWNFADRYIMYRKHLGLVGFAYVVIHTFVTLVTLSHYFPFPSYFLNRINLFPFIAAVIALIILIFMAAISNRYAIGELGGKNWKLALRTGYIAYVFSIIHFGLKTYPGWIYWLSGQGKLPPLDLIVVLFGVLVILMRLALWIATSREPAQT